MTPEEVLEEVQTAMSARSVPPPLTTDRSRYVDNLLERLWPTPEGANPLALPPWEANSLEYPGMWEPSDLF